MSNCDDEVAGAGGDGFNKSDAKAIIQAVYDRAQEMRETKGLSELRATLQAAREAGDRDAYEAARSKYQKLDSLQKRVNRRSEIAEVFGRMQGRLKDNALREAMLNQLVAKNSGKRAAAESRQKTLVELAIGGLEHELRQAGLYKAALSGDLDKQWGRELSELNKRQGKPGVTGSSEALEIARIGKRALDAQTAALNREGADIGSYDGRVMRTVHDPDRIRAAGVDAWADFARTRLDPERMGVETMNFKSAFDQFTSGHHLRDSNYTGIEDEPVFKNGANVANKLAASREWHFKDADAWLEYQERFGTQGTLMQQLANELERGSKQLALLERWGVNPRAAMESDIDWAKDRFVHEAPAAVGKLRDGEPLIRNRFDYLDGTANQVADRTTAKIGRAIRGFQAVTKLGGVALTHFSTLATKTSELRDHGVPFAEAVANSIKGLIVGPRGMNRELAYELHAGLHGMMAHLSARRDPDGALWGRAGRIQNFFYDAAGLTWELEGQKTTTIFKMSAILGRHIGEEFEQLPVRLQRSLSRYHIRPAEWDALREAPDHTSYDGITYLTGEAARRTSEDAIRRIAGDAFIDEKGVAAMRERLAQRLDEYFHDIADRAVVTPGIDDRAFFMGGTRAGTFAGEFWRYVSQFKVWGSAAVRQGLGREWYGNESVPARIAGILKLAGMSYVAGLAVMTLKDLVQGKTPRDWKDPMTILAAMIQGGTIGILGDYLFGQFDRHGHTLAENLLGPTVGSLAGDLANLKSNAVSNVGGNAREQRASSKEIKSELIRLGVTNLPFANLFYVRPALNYLFLHSLQESINPGYLSRYERALKQRTGQTYLLSPAQHHAHTFGH